MRVVDKKLYDLFVKFGMADQRVGQTLINFASWHEKKYGTDFFGIENDLFIKRLETYFNESFVEVDHFDSFDPPRREV